MKVTAKLQGGEFSRIEALVSEARRRAVERIEIHLVARAERARLLRRSREIRREANSRAANEDRS